MTLAPIDATSEVAVTDYLTKARDWLDRAVTESTPMGIGQAKVELTIAAEATKHLNLSREIQQDAEEMVRRAEFVLRKSVTKAQEAGDLASREGNLTPGQGNPIRSAPSDTSKGSPRDFFGSGAEYRDANAMGALDEQDFDQVLDEAKAEGNLSRANVARKAREKAGRGEQRAKPRKPLTDAARDAGWDLRKAVERLERIAADNRFAAQTEQVTPLLRSHLTHAVEVCQDLLDRLETN